MNELQTNKDCLVYLQRFMDWRTGKDLRSMPEAGIDPAKISNAITRILMLHGMSNSLINCNDCIHYRQDSLETCDLKQRGKCDKFERTQAMNKFVFISSPYRGDVKRNLSNAVEYCKRAVDQGYIPIAPHLFFPQFVEDTEEGNAWGICSGLELLKLCGEVWVHGEPSSGMQIEIATAKQLGIKILYKPGIN